jgi:hypothetical protein
MLEKTEDERRVDLLESKIHALFVESRASVRASPKASPARRSLSRRGAIDLELRAA